MYTNVIIRTPGNKFSSLSYEKKKTEKSKSSHLNIKSLKLLLSIFCVIISSFWHINIFLLHISILASLFDQDWSAKLSETSGTVKLTNLYHSLFMSLYPKQNSVMLIPFSSWSYLCVIMQCSSYFLCTSVTAHLQSFVG